MRGAAAWLNGGKNDGVCINSFAPPLALVLWPLKSGGESIKR